MHNYIIVRYVSRKDGTPSFAKLDKNADRFQNVPAGKVVYSLPRRIHC